MNLAENKVQIMDWSAFSPEMNPIEQSWDILGRRLRQRIPQPETRAQLGVALVQELNNIPRVLTTDK